MKTIAKLIMSTVVMFGIMVTANSCKKETKVEGAPHGYMTVKMTDAPAEYLAVYVDIAGMNVHTTSAGWVNVPIKSGIYNLLELQNNMTVVLADDVALPIGEVSQIRLVLGSRNSIVTTEGQFALKTPSAEESGLKINLHQTIANGRHMIVVLDFDANASIVQTGTNEYSLKPVITVKSVIQ